MTARDIVDLRGRPTPLEDDLEFVADCCRYAEKILSEEAVRKKWRFDNATWVRLSNDEKLIEAIEREKVRRTRTGTTARERAQVLFTEVPDVLGGILRDGSASPRHRIESAKELRQVAATGPENHQPTSDRFVITINLGSSSLHFDKPLKPIAIDASATEPNDVELNNTDPDDVDPNKIDPLPWVMLPANKREDGGGDNTL